MTDVYPVNDIVAELYQLRYHQRNRQGHDVFPDGSLRKIILAGDSSLCHKNIALLMNISCNCNDVIIPYFASAVKPARLLFRIREI